MASTLIRSTLFVLSLLCAGLAYTQTVQVTVLNGEEIRCFPDSMVQIRITPNPAFTYTQIFLDWGDGTPPLTILPGQPLVRNHAYPIAQFLDDCTYGDGCPSVIYNGFCFQISVLAQYMDAPTENVQKIMTFQMPPRPAFVSSPSVICAGSQVSFDNQTCPSNDNTMMFEWRFHDGSTQTTTDAMYTYPIPGSFPVVLTATNSCGTAAVTRPITVQPLPIAAAALDSGSISIQASIDTVCLTTGGIVRLHATASQFESERNWRIIPNTGFQLIGPNNRDTVRYDFNTAGNYTVILEVDNACNTPDFDTLQLVVLPRLVLDLAPQADDCPSLTYTPSPLRNDVLYTVNGVATPASSFPLNLSATGLSPDTYVISARLSNACETLTRRDTFLLFPAVNPSLLSPTADTIICPDTTLLPLRAFPNGTTWSGPGVVLVGGQYFFNTNQSANTYELTYSYGTGDCLRSGTVDVSVQNVTVDVGGPVSICEDEDSYQLVFSPPGGQWSGPGITDATLGVFQPDSAALGVNTLFYTFTDATTGCTLTRSKAVTVVGLPLITMADTLQDICRANTLLSLPLLAGLSVQPAGGTPNWTGAGITDAATGQYNPSLSPAGATAVSLGFSYTIAPGCTSRDSLVVVLGELVPAQAGSDTTVCGTQGSITLSGTPGGGQWSGPSIDPLTGLLNVAALVPNTYTYTYTRFAGTSCESADMVAVTVSPSDGLSLAQNTIYVCDTASLISLPAAMPTTGTWSGLPGISGDTLSLPAAGMYTLTYTVASLPAGCNTADLSLNILPRPQAAIAGDDLGCAAAGCVPLGNASTGADSYLWDFGDGTTSMSFAPCHVFPAEAVYTVSLRASVLHPLTNEALCSDLSTASINVLAPPSAADIDITSTSNPLGCAELTISFAAVATGQQLGYAWTFGNMGTSDLQNPLPFSFPQGIEDTTYQVQLRVSNLCGEQVVDLPVEVFPQPRADLGVTFEQPCSGDTLFLTNRSTGNPATNRWVLSNGQVFDVFQPPFIVPFTGDSPTTLGIWLYTENQCGQDSVFTEVVVLPTDVQAQFNRSAEQVCPGEPIVFTNISTPLAPVRWLSSDGNAYLGDTITHTFAEPGLYEMSLYAYGCGFDSVVWPIEVLPRPSGEVVASAIPCEGAPVTLSVLTSSAAAQILYYGTGDSTLLRLSQYVYPAAGSYLTRLVLTSDFGCQSESTRLLTVQPRPEALAATVDSVCAGQPVLFQSLSTGGQSCFWSFGDGQIADQCTTDHRYTLSGGYVAYLTAVSNLGCRDTLEVPVYVRPTPEANFSIDVSPVCSPTPVNFTNQTQTATSYEWSFGDGASSTLSSPSYTYDSGSEYTVTLIAGYEGICFDTLSQPLRVRGTPRFDTLVINERCLPTDRWIMEILPVPGVALEDILVSGNNFFQNNINGRIELVNPGAYTLSLIAVNGCEASLPFFVPAVDPIVIRTIPDTTITWGDDVLLSTQTNTSNLDIIWTPDSRLSATGLLSPVASPLQTTTYVVRASRASCAAYDTVTVRVIQDELIYFPNAFSPNGDGNNDVYTIFIANDSMQLSSFRIFDRWGQQVFHQDDPPLINGQIQTWDGLNLVRNINDARRRYNPGVFAYLAEVRLVDGTSKWYKGDIHLVR